MAITGILPEHAYGPDYGQNPIGSGRYIMKQWDKGQQVIFEANPDYYGEAPKMKQGHSSVYGRGRSVCSSSGRTGRILHIRQLLHSDLTVDGYDLLAFKTVDNRGFNLPAVPSGVVTANGIAAGNDFTSDVRVRRAINLGIDRDEMIEHVLNELWKPGIQCLRQNAVV